MSLYSIGTGSTRQFVDRSKEATFVLLTYIEISDARPVIGSKCLVELLHYRGLVIRAPHTIPCKMKRDILPLRLPYSSRPTYNFQKNSRSRPYLVKVNPTQQILLFSAAIPFIFCYSSLATHHIYLMSIYISTIYIYIYPCTTI